MTPWTRKHFLKTSFIGAGTALLPKGRAAAAVARSGSANGDVRIAVVGLRGKGHAHVQDFLKIPGVRIAALCDVDSRLLGQRADELEKEWPKVARYIDYRRLLEDRSIDAVALATPNHWHALQTIWACQAGKDVYVEKPVSHNVWEGRKAVEAAIEYNRIVQAGTQSRSDEGMREACAYLRAGRLGKIKWARGLCYTLRESIGRTSGPQAVPAHIEYDLWSGPAPLVPPRRNTPKFGPVHYDWHWLWNYGGGDIANQGIHQMDVARWMLGENGLAPAVMSLGGRFGYVDDGETANTQIAVLEYARAPLIFEVRGLPTRTGMRASDAYRGMRVGIVVQCEHGYITGRTGAAAYDNDGKRIAQFVGHGGGEHQANFIAAVRSRKSSDLAAPIEEGHVSSALCHLANISYRLGSEKSTAAIREIVQRHDAAAEAFGRMIDHLEANDVDTAQTPTVMGPRLVFNPSKEVFVSRERFDAGYWANTMLAREYRRPFVVPEKV